ncbi:MAG: AAA family ATPase [Planctomycetaceae bacterium]|nr:AAA family ATPase [Planctomycetaceae bacterium]
MTSHNKFAEKKILDTLADVLGRQRFDLWFSRNISIRLENEKVIFGVQGHVIDWIRSSFKSEIEQACRLVLSKNITAEFIVDNNFPNKCTDKIDYQIEPAPSIITPNSTPICQLKNAKLNLSSAKFNQPPSSVVDIVAQNINSRSHNSGQQNPFNLPPSANAQSTGLQEPNKLHFGNVNQNTNPKNTAHRNTVQSRFVTAPVMSPAMSPISMLPRAVAGGGRRFASLDTFIEGLSNRLALRGVEFAINCPCQINPIYIYGPSSVGKTHLLEGLWSKFKTQAARKSPLYMTTEQFVSGFLEGIQTGASRSGIYSFRDKFKGISILLIDDIQHFFRKDATQTEFLYTIDTLKSQGVQIVLTGDRPLNKLTGLRREIIARLEAGMSCGIELPERELSLQIFNNMAKQRKMLIGDDVSRFICSRIGTNARRLSGALNRLIATSDGTPITVETAGETLKDMIQDNQHNVRLQDIGKIVSETFGISEESLLSKNRSKQTNTPRMLAMWLARKYTRSALSEIGKYFGDRSHSTVVTAQKKVDQWLDEKLIATNNNQNIKQTIKNIEIKLTGV